jgi:hypothetical protein
LAGYFSSFFDCDGEEGLPLTERLADLSMPRPDSNTHSAAFG